MSEDLIILMLLVVPFIMLKLGDMFEEWYREQARNKRIEGYSRGYYGKEHARWQAAREQRRKENDV